MRIRIRFCSRNGLRVTNSGPLLRMLNQFIFPSVCLTWALACSPKQEKEPAAEATPQGVASVAAKVPIVLKDDRVYRRIDDNGAQGRDTFLLKAGTYTHINWNGIRQKWYLESNLVDTAANGVWVMRTTGHDYAGTPIDHLDSFQVKQFDKEAVITPWLGNKAENGRHLPRFISKSVKQ